MTKQFQKGDRVVYQSGHGCLYEALVLRVHRDTSWTVRVQWPLDADGKPMLNCFQGDKFRVGPRHILGQMNAA